MELHVEPQSTPAGFEDTAPVPVPVFETVRLYVFNVNIAVTDLACVIDTTHDPAPEHAPDHDENDEPAAGVADNVTDVP